jgi:hypothetical protein
MHQSQDDSDKKIWQLNGRVLFIVLGIHLFDKWTGSSTSIDRILFYSILFCLSFRARLVHVNAAALAMELVVITNIGFIHYIIGRAPLVFPFVSHTLF